MMVLAGFYPLLLYERFCLLYRGYVLLVEGARGQGQAKAPSSVLPENVCVSKSGAGEKM